MKHFFLSLVSLIVFASGASALDLSSFSVESEFETAEFAELESLETSLNENAAQFSFEEILQKSELSNHYQFRSRFASGDSGWSIDDMDWGSFAWGFCCCPIGFFVVAINSNKDSDQKLSYWIGVGINVVLSAISSIATISSGTGF